MDKDLKCTLIYTFETLGRLLRQHLLGMFHLLGARNEEGSHYNTLPSLICLTSFGNKTGIKKGEGIEGGKNLLEIVWISDYHKVFPFLLLLLNVYSPHHKRMHTLKMSPL